MFTVGDQVEWFIFDTAHDNGRLFTVTDITIGTPPLYTLNGAFIVTEQEIRFPNTAPSFIVPIIQSDDKHKCKCEWRDVYMKGCSCGGT